MEVKASRTLFVQRLPKRRGWGWGAQLCVSAGSVQHSKTSRHGVVLGKITPFCGIVVPVHFNMRDRGWVRWRLNRLIGNLGLHGCSFQGSRVSWVVSTCGHTDPSRGLHAGAGTLNRQGNESPMSPRILTSSHRLHVPKIFQECRAMYSSSCCDRSGSWGTDGIIAGN